MTSTPSKYAGRPTRSRLSNATGRPNRCTSEVLARRPRGRSVYEVRPSVSIRRSPCRSSVWATAADPPIPGKRRPTCENVGPKTDRDVSAIYRRALERFRRGSPDATTYVLCIETFWYFPPKHGAIDGKRRAMAENWLTNIGSKQRFRYA